MGHLAQQAVSRWADRPQGHIQLFSFFSFSEQLIKTSLSFFLFILFVSPTSVWPRQLCKALRFGFSFFTSARRGQCTGNCRVKKESDGESCSAPVDAVSQAETVKAEKMWKLTMGRLTQQYED